MRTLCKPFPKVRSLSRFCPRFAQKCKPFRFIRERVAKSGNPLQIYVKIANPQIIHFGSFEWFGLLVKFWQACARKCEPFASLRQKCEPFASLSHNCEPLASLRQKCEPLRLLVKACPKVPTLSETSTKVQTLRCAPLRIAACNGQHASPPQLNQIDLTALQQPI